MGTGRLPVVQFKHSFKGPVMTREEIELLRNGIGKTFKVTAPGETFYGNLHDLTEQNAHFVDVQSSNGRQRTNLTLSMIQVEQVDGPTETVTVHRWEALALIDGINHLRPEWKSDALRDLKNELKKIADRLGSA